MTTRYFKGIRKQLDVCVEFQSFLQKKTGYRTYLERQKDPAPIDYIGRIYIPINNQTIKKLAVEIKTDCRTFTCVDEVYISKNKYEALELHKRLWVVYIVWQFADGLYYVRWHDRITEKIKIWGRRIKIPTSTLSPTM